MNDSWALGMFLLLDIPLAFLLPVVIIVVKVCVVRKGKKGCILTNLQDTSLYYSQLKPVLSSISHLSTRHSY